MACMLADIQDAEPCGFVAERPTSRRSDRIHCGWAIVTKARSQEKRVSTAEVEPCINWNEHFDPVLGSLCERSR